MLLLPSSVRSYQHFDIERIIIFLQKKIRTIISTDKQREEIPRSFEPNPSNDERQQDY